MFHAYLYIPSMFTTTIYAPISQICCIHYVSYRIRLDKHIPQPTTVIRVHWSAADYTVQIQVAVRSRVTVSHCSKMSASECPSQPQNIPVQIRISARSFAWMSAATTFPSASNLTYSRTIRSKSKTQLACKRQQLCCPRQPLFPLVSRTSWSKLQSSLT